MRNFKKRFSGESTKVQKFQTLAAILFALVMSTSKTLAFPDPSNCQLQNDIEAMVLDAKAFLKHLETGAVPDTVWKLERRLSDTGVASLIQRLKENGHRNLAARVQSFVKEQRLLLYSHKNSGRSTTLATARDMQSMRSLKTLHSRNAALPCGAPRGSEGLSHTESGGFSQGLVESGALHFFGVAVLLGGIAAGAFGWWSQISRRRAKRHNCMIPCILTGSKGRHPVILVNLSRSGAKVQTDVKYRVGEQLELRMLGETLACRAVRSKSSYVALDFYEMINTSVLDKALFKPEEVDAA